MKISIIIVSYNTKEFLDKCLNSIFKNSFSKAEYEVIVVDNCSKDKTTEILSTKYTHVRWINLKENLGFTKANNIGIQESSKESQYLFFLNPDTILEEFSLEKLFEYINNNQSAGIISPKIELPDGSIDDACHRGFPTPWNAFCYFSGLAKIFPHSSFFNGYHLAFKNIDKTHPIDACAGAAMLVRLKAGQEINWWDEDFFWYGDDLDFCYRVKNKGWQVIFYPETTVIHFKGVSGGIKKHSQKITTADEKTRRIAQKARFEAMRLFYKKHYLKKYPVIITSLVLLGIKVFELIKKIK